MSPRAAKAGKNRKRTVWDFFRSSAATRVLICLLGVPYMASWLISSAGASDLNRSIIGTAEKAAVIALK